MKDDSEPQTPLGKELKRLLAHLEEPGAWPDAKPDPDVDWEELIRTHPAFRDIHWEGEGQTLDSAGYVVPSLP